jgi:sugar lactone lactonase YvrE
LQLKTYISFRYLTHRAVFLVFSGLIAFVVYAQSIFQLGYALLTPDATSPIPFATSLLQTMNSGVLISETSIGVASPVRSGLIFVDELQTRTGLVFVNPGDGSATVTLSLREAGGKETSRRVISVGPHRQLSQFTSEVFGSVTTNFKGSVAFQSDQPVVVAGLRQNLNYRREAIYTVTPTLDSSADDNATAVIPFVRSGDLYSTQIILLNKSEQRTRGTLKLLGDQLSESAYDIPPNGIQTMDLGATGSLTGYAEAFAEAGSKAPGILAFVQLKTTLGLISETVVPQVPATLASRSLVEEIQGMQTQLNLANPNADATDIVFTLLDHFGETIASATRTLPAQGYLSASADDLFPDISFGAGFLGQIEIDSATPFSGIAMRTTTNGRNDSIVASLRTFDLASQITAPIVFPQVLNGSGFSTRLIMLNGNGMSGAGGQIAFFQPDGTPMNMLTAQGSSSGATYQISAGGIQQLFPGNTGVVSNVSLRDPVSNEPASEITINEGQIVRPNVVVIDSSLVVRDDFKVTATVTNPDVASVDPTGAIVGRHIGFSSVVIEAGGMIMPATVNVVGVEGGISGYDVGGIGVDAAHRLYLASAENHTVFLMQDVRQAPTVWAGTFRSPGLKDDVRLASQFNNPSDLALQSNGTVYVSDSANHVIRQILPGANGHVSTIPNATFKNPQGIALDDRGYLWVADSGDHVVQRINLVTGEVTTIAGQPGVKGFADGQGTQALFNSPTGIAFEPESLADQLAHERSGQPRRVQMIVADTGNGVIRRVTEKGDVNTITTPPTLQASQVGARIVSTASSGAIRFNNPVGVTVDAAGTIYVAAGGDVRAILKTRSVVRATQAGTLGQPKSIAVADNGKVLISDHATGPQQIQFGEPGITSVTPDRISSRGGTLVTIRGLNLAPETVVVLGGSVIPDVTVSNTETITFTSPPLESGRTTLTVQNRGGIGQHDFVIDPIRLQDLPPGSITTLVGGTTFAGDGGPAIEAPVNLPEQTAIDSAGNIYFTDTNNQRIRRVDHSTGVITTVAGNGNVGSSGDGGPAIAASFSFPSGIALDSSGNIFISDTGNSRIRKVDSSTGIVATVAGGCGQKCAADNGPAVTAPLNAPRGLAFDAAGNLFVADSTNHRIRKITPAGIITTVAGNGNADFSGDNGPATDAALNGPRAVAVDSTGNLWVADTFNNRVRQVDSSGKIRTLNSGDLLTPRGVAVSVNGDVLISDSGNHRILRVSISGDVSLVAGTGKPAFSGDGGNPTNASLDPYGVSIDGSGIIVIADHGNNRIRKIAEGGTRLLTPFGVNLGPPTITTVAGNGQPDYLGDNGPATAAKLSGPSAVVTDAAGNTFIADANNSRVRRVDFATGIITTVAGSGVSGFGGDGGQAVDAQINSPQGLAIDVDGSLYIADTNNHRIRKVDLNGVIRTIGGSGVAGYSGDNQPATAAALSSPSGIAIDGQGNLYIADTGNSRIRKLTVATGLITTVAGNGSARFSNDGQLATDSSLNTPRAVAIDLAGNFYIADSGNDRVRRVDSRTQIIQTVAGNGNRAYSGDGGDARAASLNFPRSVAIAQSGLLILDSINQRLRLLQLDTGIIRTIAGNGIAGFSGDNGPADKAMVWTPSGVAVDAAGNVLVADTVNQRVRGVRVSSQ